jgi:hypothetical protein
MRMVKSMSKAVAMIAGGVFVTSTASATVVFDGTTSDFYHGQNGSTTSPLGGKFVLDNLGTGPLDPNLFSLFVIDAAGSIGPDDNVVALPGETTIRITARLTPEDSGLPGRTLIAQLSEFNANYDNGVDPIADRHENFNYAVDPNDFVQGVFTSIEFPASSAVFVFTSFPDGSGFNPNPINSILDASTLGVNQFSPQDPTSDGATSSNPFGGTIGIEIQSIELVPEPASLALLGLGGLAVLRRRA